jgi:hypothetical protein
MSQVGRVPHAEFRPGNNAQLDTELGLTSWNHWHNKNLQYNYRMGMKDLLSHRTFLLSSAEVQRNLLGKNC